MKSPSGIADGFSFVQQNMSGLEMKPLPRNERQALETRHESIILRYACRVPTQGLAAAAGASRGENLRGRKGGLSG